MDRKEAVALISELIDRKLAVTSFVYLKQNSQGDFDLVVKGKYDGLVLRAFLADKECILREDKEKGTCTIYKP